MSKAILVMDMPSSCIDCRFCREIDEGINACCEIMDEPNDNELCRMIDVSYPQEKPDWCPLKPMPQKQDIYGKYNSEYYAQGGKSASYKIGYNTCIDEILGDKE